MQIYTFLASMTFQQPGSSQRKWTQQEWTQPTQQTTQSSTVETWKPCLVAERSRVCAEMSFGAVSCCDLAQNLETAQLLISKKDLDKPNCDGLPIIHKRDATPCFYSSFIGIADDWSRPAICATVRFLQIVIVSYPPPPSPPYFSVCLCTHNYATRVINITKVKRCRDGMQKSLQTR